MENIYQEAVRAVEDGARFKVDFQTRSLKIDGKYVIRDGSYEGVLGVPHCSEEEFFSKVEELYHRYKHSIPSERSESTSRRYFTALPERELSDDDMLYGERRDKITNRTGTVHPLPTARRLQMESREVRPVVLAEQRRQGAGNTQRMGRAE